MSSTLAAKLEYSPTSMSSPILNPNYPHVHFQCAVYPCCHGCPERTPDQRKELVRCSDTLQHVVGAGHDQTSALLASRRLGCMYRPLKIYTFPLPP